MSNNQSAVEAVATAQKVCPACNSRYGDEVAFCSRDGTPLVVDPGTGKSDLVGQVLADRYRVQRLLGEGGMGQVYEAQHVNINKRFAIKLLRPEIVSNAEAVARFRQEAWSASSIGHENIIEIDDFSTLPNGSVYLAMEYLSGCALAERMRTPPPLQLDEALDILIQVARGLDAAHKKGIVHRDMKPENVFLAHKYGRVLVKILDFGIAKVAGAEGSQSLTRTGTIFGTPHYMSPEQALGKPLDQRADIYSVGVIMYEAFTGRVPFEAESFMGILTKHITVQPTPPSQLAPDRHVPPEIEAVILKAMAKDAGDRQQSMEELLAELTQVAELLAPHVLTLPSGSVSTQVSSQMSAQMPIPTPPGVRVVTPVPGTGGRAAVRPSGASVAARVLTGQGAVAELDDHDLAAIKPKRTGVIVAAIVFTVTGAVAAAVLLFAGKKPGTTPPVAVVAPKPPTVAGVAPTVPTPPGAAVAPVDPPKVAVPATPPKEIVILVDSEPVGAQLVLDGVSIGDTPEDVKLPEGKVETLVLHKQGYLDQPLVLDGKSAPRRVIHLVRVPSKDSHSAVKLPPPPVAVTHQPPPGVVNRPPPPPVVVTRPPPVVPAAHPPARKGNDPYERVVEPRKGSDIINPY